MMLWIFFYSFVGGMMAVLVKAKRKRDIIRFKAVRHLAVALLSGFVVEQLILFRGISDGLLAIAVGYYAPSVLESILSLKKPEAQTK